MNAIALTLVAWIMGFIHSFIYPHAMIAIALTLVAWIMGLIHSLIRSFIHSFIHLPSGDDRHRAAACRLDHGPHSFINIKNINS
jgi:uncharacterized membrane protein YqaE (UPF0057 family)